MSLPHEAKKDPEQEQPASVWNWKRLQSPWSSRWIHRTDISGLSAWNGLQKSRLWAGIFLHLLKTPGHPPSFGTTP